MGVALHQPFRARAALDAALVAAIGLFVVDVPYGVPGIGEGVPFDAVEAGAGEIHAELLGQVRAHQPLCATLQISGYLRRVVVRHQSGLGDRLAFADRAGGDVFEPVAEWRTSTGAVSLPHVLGHAGETFFAGHEAVHLVHRMQHGRQDDAGDAIQLGGLGEHHLDVALAAFVHEAVGDILIAGEARGVDHQHHAPQARLVVDLADQALEAGTVGILAALDGVGELFSDDQVARLGQRLQLAPLGVDRDVRSIMT